MAVIFELTLRWVSTRSSHLWPPLCWSTRSSTRRSGWSRRSDVSDCSGASATPTKSKATNGCCWKAALYAGGAALSSVVQLSGRFCVKAIPGWRSRWEPCAGI